MPAVDLTPLEFSMAVLCGYFALVFLILSFLPGAATQQIGERE